MAFTFWGCVQYCLCEYLYLCRSRVLKTYEERKNQNENPVVHPQKVALLIDGDNASSAKLAERYGEVIIRKIYGEWSKTSLFSWQEPAREYSIG
ncbi:MAG TPA: hypothetical protein DIT04_12015 [Dysgonomonas sp.]|nr:hypothetical protein [Dysgonomonas sp.]